MTPPPTEPSKQPPNAETPSSNTLKFSKKQLVLAFVIAGISDAVGAFIAPLPPIGWVADLSWCWDGSGCYCRDWLWRPFRAWEYFHSGCWWLERLLSLALVDQGLNGTLELRNRFLIRCSHGRASLQYVRFWHEADIPCAYPMSAFGGKADIGRRMCAVPSGFLFGAQGATVSNACVVFRICKGLPETVPAMGSRRKSRDHQRPRSGHIPQPCGIGSSSTRLRLGFLPRTRGHHHKHGRTRFRTT